MKLPVLLYLIFALANAAFATSSASPHPSFIEAPAFDNEPLRQWLAETNANATVLQALWNEADWSWATDISPEHEAAGVAAAMRYQSFSLTAAAQAQVWLQRAAAASLVDSTLLRQTRMWASTDLPPLESDRQRLLERVKAMENMYSTARCAANNMTLGALSQVMGSSSDADTLLQSWRCWHDTARPMRPLYREFVSLANAGAAANGFADDGQFWRSFYDMPAADFGQLVESLWHEVKPLYVELHAYVRARLVEFYGEKVVNKSAAIPAHLLGNMWAQSWGNLCVHPRSTSSLSTTNNIQLRYNIIPGMVPYPDVPSPPDASPFMKQKGLSSRDVVRIAERFFRSLGMRELPPSFWNLSLFDEPPAPRQAVCHASAWDFTNGAVDDVRLKMCVEITEEDLVTAHHELGHLYYDLSYVALSPRRISFT
jgi:peptidyl-dipeptidase A